MLLAQAALQSDEPGSAGTDAAVTVKAERNSRLELERRKGPRVEIVKELKDEAVKMES